MANKSKIAQKFAEMPPKKRMLVAGGAVFSILAVVGILMSPSGPAPIKKPKDAEHTSLAMPGGGRDLSFEKLSAQIDATQQELARQKDRNKSLEKELANKTESNNQPSPQSLADMQKLKDDIEALKKKPSLDDELPPPQAGSDEKKRNKKTSGEDGADNAGGEGDDSQASDKEQPQLRVLGGGPKDKQEEDEKASDPIVFLPSGSNFEGILLNGMDAPTSAVTMKNPVPALMRIKTDAILPNRHRYDVRECFVIISGFGVLSTERAQLQLVSLSCVKTDGSVIDTKMDGYIVGEDGKVGMRGRLVTKQGQLIAKSMAAGFFAGIASNMTPQAVPQLNVNPGASTQFQMPSIGNAAQAGVAQGISTSATAISKFYLDMAKEMFPVIEIDAMRRVTIILTKGVELNVNSGKDK